MKTKDLKRELEKYKEVLIAYAFVETCTASIYFKELFHKELLSTGDAIEKANIPENERTKMIRTKFFGVRDETPEQTNHNHYKRLVSWAKHNLNQLPSDIKKKIIDESITYQDAWSEQFNHNSKVIKDIEEIENKGEKKNGNNKK